MDEVKAKPHGCMCPLHPFQIASYAIFFFYAYVFYFIEMVSWQQMGGILAAFIVPYTGLFGAIAVLAIVATLSDPTDPTVYEERRLRALK
jgi:hypothetical protein